MKVMLNGKIWDEESVKALLDRSDEAVGRALIVVYNNQTESEKVAFATRESNGKGFCSNDAEWLTDIAKKWLRWRKWASPKQCAAVRKAIRKYHRQILQDILDKNQDAVVVTAREARRVTTINPIAPQQPQMPPVAVNHLNPFAGAF